jgi:hypothetical protein
LALFRMSRVTQGARHRPGSADIHLCASGGGGDDCSHDTKILPMSDGHFCNWRVIFRISGRI